MVGWAAGWCTRTEYLSLDVALLQSHRQPVRASLTEPQVHATWATNESWASVAPLDIFHADAGVYLHIA